MSSRRRKRPRDHRRGKSIEDIARQELTIIVDENEIDSLGGIQEDSEIQDEELSRSNSRQYGLHIVMGTPSEDYMGELLDEIDKDLAHQYPTPPDVCTPNTDDSRLTPRGSYDINLSPIKRQRSDSHWRSQTPLAVKKYTNYEIDFVVKNQKPRLLKADDELPLLVDIKGEEATRDMLIQKLSLCEVLCDFRIVNDIDCKDRDEEITDNDIMNELHCIANKKEMLKECATYITKTKWDSTYLLEQIIRSVQTNLFRSLPDSFIIKEFCGVDHPIKFTLPSWEHLQYIYEVLFQVIMGSNIEKDKLATYFTGSFMNNFVQLFHSLCKAEVDYIKIIIHSMYMDFVALRDEIRICLSQYCWDFIYNNNGTPDGINAILDIMNSILQGLDDEKLNDPQKWYIVLCHVLCPLHKGVNFKKFEVSLYKCIKTYIKSKPEHFVVIFNHGILRFWPKTNPSKEALFMKCVLNILKLIKRAKYLCDAQFTNIFRCLIEQIVRNLLSTHYQIVQQTIDSFKDKLMRQCIDFHGGESGWKSIYKALIYVTHNHYLYITRDSSKQMLDWLKKYRITKKHVQLFEKLENQYNEKTKQEFSGDTAICNQEQHENKWHSLSILAQRNKKKLAQHKKKMKFASDTRIAPISTILEAVQSVTSQELALAKAYSYDEETNTFKYPSNFVSSPLTRAASYQNTFKFSKHQKRHSQPLTSRELSIKELKPHPIHTKRSSELEDNFGYPQVHKAYKSYVDNKKIDCRSPSHLVLFSKKEGMKGVTFSSTNKYFKQRKVAVAKKKTRKMNQKRKAKQLEKENEEKKEEEKKRHKKKKKKKKRKPTKVESEEKETNIAQKDNNDDDDKKMNIKRFRRSTVSRSRGPSITSPLIAAIRREKMIEDEIDLDSPIEESPEAKAENANVEKQERKEIKFTNKKQEDIKTFVGSSSILQMYKQNAAVVQKPKSKKKKKQKLAKKPFALTEIETEITNDKVSKIQNGTRAIIQNRTNNEDDFEKGSMTPATPSSIKSNPQTPNSTYWSILNSNKMNLGSLVANTITLK